MLREMAREASARRAATPETGEAKAETSVGGEVFEVEPAETIQTFDNADTLLTATTHGWPRGTEVLAGWQLGQTPLMELVKTVIAEQITGGECAFPYVGEDAEEPPDAVVEFQRLARDVLKGPHVGRMDFDDLIDAMVSDVIDTGWAYWEPLAADDGSLNVVQLKAVNPLTIQHNLDSGGQFGEPAYYHAPVLAGRTGTITPVSLTSDPDPIEADGLIAMRGPHTGKSDDPYGTPPALKAREFLEVYANSTADINRDYDDTQVPPGIFQAADTADLKAQLQQSRGDSRKAPIVDYEVDWQEIGFDTTQKRIAEQEWFLRMVLAMHGINRHEIGFTDESGLGTETPAQAKLIYKKVTLPYLKTINSAIRTQYLPLFDAYETLGQPVTFELRRVDPRQEVVEERQALKNFDRGVASVNETREAVGEDPAEPVVIEVGGEEIDLANVPTYMVDKLLAMERPQLEVSE